MIAREKKFYQTHWLNISFLDINIKLTNDIPTSAFYDHLYNKYSKYEELPENWLLQKKDSAQNIKNFLKEGDKVLSYGCGLGYVEHCLNDRNVKLSVFDSSSVFPKWLISRNQNINCLNKLNGRYDIIYLQQVSYLFKRSNFIKLLKKLKNNLSEDGKIIIIHTSLNPIENGINFKNIFLLIKNYLRTTYYFLFPKKIESNLKNQFWGWNRNNSFYIKMARNANFNILDVFTPINKSNESYILLGGKN
ncbi:methyltransferase domain-containing protein [Flavobacteriaceae bacterium]|nr:methyltransferase domain-containing protein [Flavobacteriaceae bacterium]